MRPIDLESSLNVLSTSVKYLFAWKEAKAEEELGVETTSKRLDEIAC